MIIKAVPMEAIFILTPDHNEVLLLQKKPWSFLAGQRTGIGGKMDPEDNNNLENTLRRELSEESSISPDMLHSLNFRGMITCYAYTPEEKVHYHMYAFTAICNNKDDIPLDSDDWLLQRIPKDELNSLKLTDFTEMICEKIMDPTFPRFAWSYWKHKWERVCEMSFEE